MAGWNIRFRPIPFRFGELVGGGTWSCIALDVLRGSQVMPGVIPVGTKAHRNTGTEVGTNTDTTLPQTARHSRPARGMLRRVVS
ncbi:hypothetical protein TNCT_196941 [Trichonephila clavata]|uniref:Uncharacterized protein n=1 Tax=Trichonephila clavata TaxID=2740835 RepID=A0A8X6HLA2_TRICU|nr:hypothetical protein TNCT_196941 [Trichonephila clavata]